MAANEILSAKAVQVAVRVAVAGAPAVKLNDGGGLSLQVQPSGAGWWRLRYWLASRENRLSLGTCPEVSR